MGVSATSHNRSLVLARRILLVGFLFNVVYCLIAATVFNLGYPHSTFLFRPWDRFQDFYTVLRSTADLAPYRIRTVTDVPGHPPIEVSNYFPWTHIVIYPFTLIDKEFALVIFLSIFFAGLSLAVLKISIRSGQRGLASFFSWLVFVPVNYAVVFTADRGNIECWLFLACVMGIYLISTGRNVGGAVFIGLGAAAKGFPLLFLVPLVKQRQWKALVSSIGSAAIATLVSLFCFSGTLTSNVDDLRSAFGVFGNFILYGVNGITHSISLFSAIYAAVVWWDQAFTKIEELEVWRFYYGIFAGMALVGIVTYICMKKLDLWKQWTLLVVAVELLPFPSYDYKLLYSLIPLAFLVAKNDPRLDKYLWIISLTAVPKAIVIFADVRISVLVNPVLILLTAVFIFWDEYRITPAQS